jgi:hypothetical protein
LSQKGQLFGCTNNTTHLNITQKRGNISTSSVIKSVEKLVIYGIESSDMDGIPPN